MFSQILNQITVEVKQEEELILEDPTLCEVCNQCDREDRMLLCDGCDAGYHLECLTPPLEEIPMEDLWYCPECADQAQNDAETVSIIMMM